MSGKRDNGEGSIFPYRNGFAAYVWVTTPDGERKRKWAYGKTRSEVHDKWVKLHVEAKAGPVVTGSQTVQQYLSYWLREVVEPNLKPMTAATYETAVRLYIVPFLGPKKLDRLTVRDIRTWLNKFGDTCQCCAQGKDARRPEKGRRCCALGNCCRQVPSRRTVADARTVLRSALGNAVTEELISKNVAALVRLARVRRQRGDHWSVEEARTFLEAARDAQDPLYAAYVLILVLGLRKGEVLGLTWRDVDLDARELTIRMQLQRVRRQLLHAETKTEASEAVLPLPDICVAALKLRRKRQEAARKAAGEVWSDTGLVFTTRFGTPVDPRNFNREFGNRCAKAGVRTIRVHDTRHTCGSLLAALDVHPRIAMQILRHTQIAVTMEVYTHVPSEATRKALRKLGRKLDGDGKRAKKGDGGAKQRGKQR